MASSLLNALAVFTFSLKFFHPWAAAFDVLELGSGMFGVSDSILYFVSDSFCNNVLEVVGSDSFLGTVLEALRGRGKLIIFVVLNNHVDNT